MSQSPLLASDAGIWVNCTGSVQISNLFPSLDSDGDSEARREGRAFHEVGQRILESFSNSSGELVSKPNIIGTQSKDGVVITDEIYDAALEYSNSVLKWCNRTGMMREIHIEERIELDCVFPGMYGYIDAWGFHKGTMTLAIWEGKYGHSFVDAFENWQLIVYVAGILDKLNIDGYMDQQITVEMRVAQSRCFTREGTIREWVCKASDLRAHINTAIMAAYDAINDGVCKVGTQCNNCEGRRGCETLQRVNYQGMDYQRGAEGVSLTGNDLAFELTLLRKAQVALKARLSGLESQAVAEIKNGVILPGFAAVAGKGRKRWRKDIDQEEVIAMGDMLDVDLRKPRELDTPAQVLKKGIDEDVINEYSETPTTAVKLVEDSIANMRQIFRGIK